MISTTLKSRPDQIFKTEDELQKAISEYYTGKTFTELAGEYNCSMNGIRDCLLRAGLVSRGTKGIDGREYNRKYALKEDVFEKN